MIYTLGNKNGQKKIIQTLVDIRKKYKIWGAQFLSKRREKKFFFSPLPTKEENTCSAFLLLGFKSFQGFCDLGIELLS